jgi:hypothetical protein
MSSQSNRNIKFKNNTAAQFAETMLTHREAGEFIMKHRLWDGFWKYGWVSKILIGIAILFGLKFISIIWDWFDHFLSPDSGSTIIEMGLFMKDVAVGSYDFLFSGGIKYIMLILLEVIIFHICRRTSKILRGVSSELTFKIFLKSQVRMIKVVFRSYFMEMILTILLKIGFGIFGFIDFLEPVFIFGVQCYFIGFLVLDNYSEQFDLSIKESVRYARQFIGVCLATGLVLNILLFIPFIGAIVGPALAAVTVSLIMLRISDLHLRTHPTPPLKVENNQPLIDS